MSDVEPEPRQPRLLTYMTLLYERMDKESVRVNDTNAFTWSGRLLATCTDLGIPTGSYTRVIDGLRGLGCLELIDRGNRGSVYLLHYPPTRELWDANVKSQAADLTSAPTLDILAADIKALRENLGGINIVDALKNLESRLTALESLTRNINKPQTQTQQ